MPEEESPLRRRSRFTPLLRERSLHSRIEIFRTVISAVQINLLLSISIDDFIGSKPQSFKQVALIRSSEMTKDCTKILLA